MPEMMEITIECPLCGGHEKVAVTLEAEYKHYTVDDEIVFEIKSNPETIKHDCKVP